MKLRDCRERAFDARYLLNVAAVNLAAAAAATLLFALFRQMGGWHGFFLTAAHSLTYSFFIGTPLALVFPFIAALIGPGRMAAQVLAFTIASSGATVAGCLAGTWMLMQLGLVDVPFLERFTMALRISIVIALIFGLSMFFYENLRAQLERTTLELRTRQLEEERASKLVAEARLSSLESRIHPHFLFNTLNSIASLIPDDPRRAEDMLMRLAALLRFSLDAGQRSLVPLAQELRVISDYLEIEGARLGERLRYSIEVPREMESIGVPPLSLQTLVENSVKHVIALRREGGEIRLTARALGNGVTIEVADTGPGFDPGAAPPGHGIDNLRARLAALFGDTARLETERGAPHSLVRITLLRPAPVDAK